MPFKLFVRGGWSGSKLNYTQKIFGHITKFIMISLTAICLVDSYIIWQVIRLIAREMRSLYPSRKNLWPVFCSYVNVVFSRFYDVMQYFECLHILSKEQFHIFCISKRIARYISMNDKATNFRKSSIDELIILNIFESQV